MLNLFISITYLLLNVLGLEIVSLQLHLAFQFQNLASARRQIGLQMDKRRSIFCKDFVVCCDI